MAKATKKKAAAKTKTATKTAAKKTAKKAAKKTAKKAVKKAAKKTAKKTETKTAAKKSTAKKAPAKAAAKPEKKKAAPKKSKIKKPIIAAEEIDEDKPIRVDKPSPFSKAELQEWRAVLKQRYSEVSGDIQDLIHDAMDSEDGHTMPTHQADRGSDVDLQDLSLGMLDDEETLLWQIERALHKIDTGTPIAFGLCEHSHENIQISRLKLLPWTPLSIKGAAYMEDHSYTLHDMIIDE